ncbi:MAG: sigma-E factor negative regulatory protein [Betaproteobacteria bacterium]|nr:sigma-E factor negative regulatory protein [Betaproteobacteria bacterium]
MKEEISALLDGELEPRAVSPCLERLEKSPELLSDWGLYQLIGDHLRGAPTFSPSFPRRFSARLSDEPTVIVPYRLQLWRASASHTRLLIPLFASLAGVAMLAWEVLSFGTRPSRELMITTVPAPMAASVSLDYFQTRPGGAAWPTEASQGTASVNYRAESPQGH